MPDWSSTEATFAATFDVVEDVRFSVDLSSTDTTFNFAFSGETALPENYLGPYEVTPKGSEQELETENKYLTDNIVVREIKRWDVGNTSGGNTVYIGEDT